MHSIPLTFFVRQEMLKDVVRTETYQNAFLFKNKVECSQMADMAKEIVRSDVITVLKGKVEEIGFQSHVDVIISEWMDYFLLFENMLNTVLYARNKWLINNGVILPDKALLFLTAIEDVEYKEDKIEFWNNVYGFDMSYIRKQPMAKPLVDTFDQKQIVTSDVLVKTMDISEMASDDVSFQTRTWGEV
ncbi:protein arginine N-methyltransferase 1.1-like [Zingiber officinale]|uniref:protein arginine N-methyltransferase 1.1-like n=1 Tax=Zingiber officinale TaxID=94328 RepID=UPI001C4DD8B0|nr:protein arginine N-methyltransferase 1.1-like [Zingiber officinale]XP_042392505.1 protein arginine N-methyltransferase 1.1-like [Zingiber officinale]